MGESQLRIEDDRLIRGEGRYTSDVRFPGELALVVVRSGVGAGHIDSLVVSAARDLPGVAAVFTGPDPLADGIKPFKPRLTHPGPDGGPMRQPRFLPLAIDEVRFLGEPVAVVIAQTRAEAEDAAEAVAVDITERPTVSDPLAATAPDAPRVWDQYPDNLAFIFDQGDAAATEAAIASATHVVRQRMRISRVTAAPIEPRSAVGRYDPASDTYQLDLGTQSPHRMAGELADVFGIPAERIAVKALDCGGSFGMKNVAFSEIALVLWAARRVGAPVRWLASRLESFQCDAHGRDQWVDATLALDAEGRFLALDVLGRAGLGAYIGPSTPHPPTANIGGLAGVYRTPAIHVRVEGVFINAQITAPYRGAGRPEATYIIERMIDLAAHELGLDKAEIRRRNLIAPEQMPFKTPLTFTYDSGDFPGLLDRAMVVADWAGFAARRARSEADGKLRGIGISNPIEIAGGPLGKPNPEFARLALDPSGAAMLMTGGVDTGQGHGTAFRQVLGEMLGLDAAKISYVTGDTATVPKGTGSFGSRTLSAGGAAMLAAIDEIVEKLTPLAAEKLEANAADVGFSEGSFVVAGTNRHIAFTEVLAAHSGPIEAEAFISAKNATFPNGCHICEVEIDPATGATSLVSYAVVDDVGRVINPLLVKGQIRGGVVQGIGQALLEEIVYDETGQLISASFMDYAMPRAENAPQMFVESFPTPTASNPLGIKGAGEAGTVGALAAVMSAVCDALSTRGVRHIDMSATPLRVWQSLQDAAA
ncbi:MAG: xanthine dehydrogenase family protein molybdopterin-binding subunit [Devosia sp.]